MAILRIMSQLAVSGFQDRIKGWGLKFVSMQLTLSTYKLVSGPDRPTREQPGFGSGSQRVEDTMPPSVNLQACSSVTHGRRHRRTAGKGGRGHTGRGLENRETFTALSLPRLSIGVPSPVEARRPRPRPQQAPWQPLGRDLLVLHSRRIAGTASIRGTWRKRWSTKSPWTP